MRFSNLLKVFTIGFMLSVFLFSTIIYFRQSKVNTDNPNYKMSYNYINKKDVLPKKDSILVLFVGNSRCPGVETFMPELKDNLSKLKKKNIPFRLLFDEVYKESEDENLKKILDKHGISDSVFLIDPTNYPSKQGIYNSWRRYFSFIKDIDPKFKMEDLSYPHYFVIKNNDIIYHGNTIEETLLTKN